MVAYWRTRSRSPGTVNRTASAARPGSGQADEHGPRGRPSCSVGTGHPGDGQSHVGAQHPAGALGHGHRRGLGHHRTLGHAEHVELHLGRIADTTEPRNQRAGPRHVHQARRGQPAGQRLGQPERQPLGRQGPGHGILDRLVVDAEHHVAGRLGQDRRGWPPRARRGAAAAVLGSAGPHRDPDLDPLDAAGQEGDGGGACPAGRPPPGRRATVDVAGQGLSRGPTRSSPTCG